MNRILFIDLDNCPNHLERLAGKLDEFSRIIVCYGGMEPKIPLRLLPPLARPVLDGRLEIIGMKKKGKNAADFGLAFLAGRLMAETPTDTQFLILSNDSDLDHVVNLLGQFERNAQRLNGSDKTLSTSTGSNGASKNGAASSLPEMAKAYLASCNHPRRKTTLKNSIKAYLKNKNGFTVDQMLNYLVGHGYVTVTQNGKIEYPPAPDDPDDIPF